VLKDFGPVDDLGRNPHLGRGHDVNRGKDLGLRGGLDLQLRLSDMSEHRGWDGVGDGGVNSLGDSDWMALRALSHGSRDVSRGSLMQRFNRSESGTSQSKSDKERLHD